MPFDIVASARAAFRRDAASQPQLCLRAGAAIDEYREAPPFDPLVDAETDEYLERYAFDGLPHLDPDSWRHYLPRLIEYAMRHPGRSEGMVVEALVWSLRPPDRDPPRLASITPGQEDVVRAFLEHLAFGDESLPESGFALQVMEEWWIPGALYRPANSPGRDR